MLGILLGYNLTDVNENIMKNQYDGQYSKNVEELTKYVSFFIHCIAQNLGGGNFGDFGETNTIHQYFTQPNYWFTKVADVNLPKFPSPKL